MSRPLIIVASVRGGAQRNRDGAYVPLTPDEIAVDAELCGEAGAAVARIQARDPKGHGTDDAATYAEIISRIRARSDILIETGPGAAPRLVNGVMSDPPAHERLALVELDPGPDLYAVAAGSTDFLWPSGGYDEESPYVSPARFLKETIQGVYAQGATLEYEIVDTHALHRLAAYADEGLFDRDAANVWLLYGGGLCFTPSDADYLGYLTRRGSRLFPRSVWGVMAAGPGSLAFLTLGIAMGATTARIGLGDHRVLPGGSTAERNHQLVERLVEIARLFGRRPATPGEARQILGPAG